MTMHPDDRRSPSGLLLGTTLAIAPLAIGCAAGLLLADRVKRKHRHGLASLCLSLGAVATLPLAVDVIVRTLDNPAYRRGSDRKLEGIRNSGLNPDADVIGGEEYFVDRLT